MSSPSSNGHWPRWRSTVRLADRRPCTAARFTGGAQIASPRPVALSAEFVVRVGGELRERDLDCCGDVVGPAVPECSMAVVHAATDARENACASGELAAATGSSMTSPARKSPSARNAPSQPGPT